MNHEAAFLDAIADDPGNDSLRLVFADYLDEHNDPRGEFIRLQIELSFLPESDSRRKALRRREQALLQKYQTQWLQPFAETINEFSFDRGLLGSIKVDAEFFLTHAEELF